MSSGIDLATPFYHSTDNIYETDFSQFFTDFKHNIYGSKTLDCENDGFYVRVQSQKDGYMFEFEHGRNYPINDMEFNYTMQTHYNTDFLGTEFCFDNIKSEPEPIHTPSMTITEIFAEIAYIEKESESISKEGLSSYVLKTMNMDALRSEGMEDTKIPTQSSKPKRKMLPKAATSVLLDWLKKNIDNPYPSDPEKENLRNLTGLALGQINNWFTNARSRRLKQLRAKRKRYGKL